MRLAYVINSLEAGGAQYPIPRIKAGLAAHGIDMTVLSLSRRNGLACAALDAGDVDYIRPDLGKSDHLKAYRWLVSELATGGYDVVWTSLSQATLIGQRAARRRGLPVISWQHNAYLKPINQRLLRWQRSLSEHWVADSESVAAFTTERLAVPPEDITILPLFVASPDVPQAELHRSGPFNWLTVGRLHPNKGHADLIDALAQTEFLDDWRLDIAGDGALRGSLQALIDSHNLSGRITLLGHRTDIPDLLASAHGYVQPSRNEGLCISAHEAMAAGLPCVVTRTGQMPLTLTGSQLTCPIGDARCVADAMARVTSDPALAAAEASLARNSVLSKFGAARFDTAIGSLAERLHGLAAQ